jgi:hypothetical protein
VAAVLNNRRGVSLSEILVSLALVSVSFMFVVGMFPLGWQALEQGRLRALAVQVAEYHMEDTRASFASGLYTTEVTSHRSVTVNNVPRILDFDAQIVAAPLKQGVYDVQVVVSWSQAGHVEYVQLETLMQGP